MIDWNFIAICGLFGLLSILVIGYLAWGDFLAYNAMKNAFDKAINITKKDSKHEMDK